MSVDVREDALCPGFLSLKRHRMLWLFLQEETAVFDTPGRLLHIAHTLCFVEAFARQDRRAYVTGDRDSPWAEHTLDAHDLPFADAARAVQAAHFRQDGHVRYYGRDYADRPPAGLTGTAATGPRGSSSSLRRPVPAPGGSTARC
jgi:hypothetical protein